MLQGDKIKQDILYSTIAELRSVDTCTLSPEMAVLCLGIDSLQMLMIVQQMSDQGYEVYFDKLHKDMTLADLSQAMFVAAHNTDDFDDKKIHCLFPGQHWFLNQSGMEVNRWNVVYFFDVNDTGFDWVGFKHCVGRLIEKHDVLRSEFYQSNKEYKMTLSNTVVEDLVKRSCVELSVSTHEFSAKALFVDDIQSAMDIKEAPLFRFVLVKNTERTQDSILFVIHHLITDVFSIGILFRDLSVLYADLALATNTAEATHLPSYSLLTKKLFAYVESEKYIKGLDYWRLPEWWDVPPIRSDYCVSERGNKVSSNRMIEISLDELDSERLLSLVNTLKAENLENILLFVLCDVLTNFNAHSYMHVIAISLARPFLNRMLSMNTSVMLGWYSMSSLLLLKRADTGPSITRRFNQFFQYLTLAPNRGLDYDLLYLADKNIEHDKLFHPPENDKVVFNYLGEIGNESDAQALNGQWTQRYNAYALDEPEDNDRLCAFRVSNYFKDSRFYCRWEYSTDLHREQTVTELINHYKHLITDLLNNS